MQCGTNGETEETSMSEASRDPRQDERRNMDCRVTRSANGKADACYHQSAHRDAEWPGTQIRMLSFRVVLNVRMGN